jgi:cell division protein FtsI/penicillin-binding protein 2
MLAGKTEATPLDCPATKVISGFSFKNAGNEALGLINLRTAFAQSCNTAFINLRESITEADMKRAALLYGFDETQPLPITSFGGSYPVPSGPVDVAASAFGQAAVLASPLQMATVAAAVASGSWRKPFVVGQSTVTHAIPAASDAALKDMMRAVVTQGTAAPNVVTFPGLVYGKTGTAEYTSKKNGPTHAWFIGFRDTVAFAVIVEGGGFGASVAAPIGARFLENLGPS